MSRLERQYRICLRLLPGWYRGRWEADMVDAFLTSMQTGDAERDEDIADYGRPSVAEIWSVFTLAVRLRLGGVGAPARSFAWGQAIRFAVLMGLLVQATTGCIGVANAAWLTGRLSWLPAPPDELPPFAVTGWNLVTFLAAALWLPAFLTLVFGHRRLAQGFALVALAVEVATTSWLSAGTPMLPNPYPLFTIALVIGLLTAFRADTAQPARTGWLVALPVALVIAAAPMLLPLVNGDAVLSGLDELMCVSLTAVMIVTVVRLRFGKAFQSPAWPMALAIITVPVIAIRLVTLAEYGSLGNLSYYGSKIPFWITAGFVEIAVLLAFGLGLAIYARTQLAELSYEPVKVPIS
jgi:hypothetical protein